MEFLNGTKKFEREDTILFFNASITSASSDGIEFDSENPTWTPIGEDNDEITRELNNETDSKKNVLGKINIDHTSGAATTEIDPIAIRGNDALSYILYLMYKYNLTGDKAKLPCMEVFDGDVTSGTDSEELYGAFTESAIVDLKSWGGDTTKINAPVTLNWCNDKVHGTYNISDNSFTETVSV